MENDADTSRVDPESGLWQSSACGVALGALSMSRPIEALAQEVLQLPADARARLLDRVVASLDADRKRDQAWDALAATRDAEIESGQSAVVSGPDVLLRLRAELD